MFTYQAFMRGLLCFVRRCQFQLAKWKGSRVHFSRHQRKSYLLDPYLIAFPRKVFDVLFALYWSTRVPWHRRWIFPRYIIQIFDSYVKFQGIFASSPRISISFTMRQIYWLISGPFSEDRWLVFSILTLLLSKMWNGTVNNVRLPAT